MPVGDTERAVAAAAALDGVLLTSAPRFAWLNSRGHLELPPAAAGAVPALRRVFDLLDGDERELEAKQLRTLPNDLTHLPTKTLIEVDEFQHFTSFRALTLDVLHGGHARFDVEAYRRLCVTWGARSDKYRASKRAGGFQGQYSRGRQRAYNDVLRDLVPPLMGWRVIRVPAAGLIGAKAYADVRVQLVTLLES